jgi:hypothetical protein
VGVAGQIPALPALSDLWRVSKRRREGSDRRGTSARVLSNILARGSGICKEASRRPRERRSHVREISEGWFRTRPLRDCYRSWRVCPPHQEGRVTKDVTAVTFSERRFRDSGLYEIVTGVLECAREHQEGRVTSEVTSVTLSEYWFRTSGLYEILTGVFGNCQKPSRRPREG